MFTEGFFVNIMLIILKYIVYRIYVLEVVFMNTSYLVTWTEGDEVFYKIIKGEEIPGIWESDKNYIITKLSS